MENSMSRIFIETIIKRTLRNIKDNPERGIRNLIDMALQFSEGRFQKDFFTAAQTMLQNENSAYYDLVRNVVNRTDSDRLLTFGMNLGYNGCTIGAQRIRENEEKFHCNIPWAITLLIDEEHFENNNQKYHAIIREGEFLGIYVWMLFPVWHPEKILSLAEKHPDSAFCIFCRAEDITGLFLDEVSMLHNVMVLVRYEENSSAVFDLLRREKLLYSAWYPYGQKDTEAIINGDLFSSIAQCAPAFTVLLPEKKCPEIIRKLVYKTVKQTRSEQLYPTLIWEFQGDNDLIDAIISDDACSVYFDANGNLCTLDQEIESPCHNLFQNTLSDILINGCHKKTTKAACIQ
ncbi:MAG: hypothetical protein Q4C91_23220 [Eubacteriales bacterium]|nr:hypothetical protein [Eubacteriales bacterium]